MQNKSRKRTIVIVEDEVIVRTDLKFRFQAMGFEVLFDTDYAEEAIDFCSHTQPDLLCLDIRLKGQLNGIQAAEEISKVKEIPILFLSAYDHKKENITAKLPNVIGYVTKPIDEGEILKLVENI